MYLTNGIFIMYVIKVVHGSIRVLVSRARGVLLYCCIRESEDTTFDPLPGLRPGNFCRPPSHMETFGEQHILLPLVTPH